VYAADSLTRHGGVSVDVFDRLPSPYGLVRYGVAPDHLKMKSTSIALQKVLEREDVRFLGNVELGARFGVEDLRQFYDAIIYATGAARDRSLGIPGEGLPGSYSATEFVAWYSGHPDSDIDRFTLDAQSVVVVGVGNVAVDVTRVLAKTADDLRHTDLPEHVLRVLELSRITDIHLIGRRGPAQAKSTSKELRELGELANADVIVRPDELVLDDASKTAIAEDRALRRNLDCLWEWSERPLSGRPRRIHIRFLLRPVEVIGQASVEGFRAESTRLDGSGNVEGVGEFEEIPAQMLFRSVGYRGRPIAGAPFDEGTGVIPNIAGRVLRNGAPAASEYVAGWIKRGPTGVIGTNKGDAHETVNCLLADADADSLPRAPERDPGAILRFLEQRDAQVVNWEGWKAIDAAEMARGATQGRARTKIAQLELMLEVASADARHS